MRYLLAYLGSGAVMAILDGLWLLTSAASFGGYWLASRFS